MTALLPLVGIGVAFLLLKSRAAAATAATAATAAPTPRKTAADVKRLVKESREIVQGKRSAYSDDPGTKVHPIEAARKVKEAIHDAKSPSAPGANDAVRAARVAAGPTPAKPHTPTAKPHKGKHAGKPSAAAPAPTAQPSESPASGPPSGFDRDKAARAAPGLAKHLAGFIKRGRPFDYSRPTLKAWQIVAGIEPDGVYGRGAAAALRSFVGSAAPKAIFKQGADSYPWGST